MSDGGLNAEYKAKWAAAQEEHGETLPKDVIYRLQEDLRLAWVKHVKGETRPKDVEQEAEGQEEEDPGDADPPEDGEPGVDASELAPAETLETRRPAPKRASRARKPATGKATPRKKRKRT